MQRLINLIPEKELIDKLNEPLCELSFDFLFFEDFYNIVASTIPNDKIIIDIGCYMAAQAYFFLDNPLYIGVDNYEINASIFPKRFTTKNSIHIVCDALTWIKERKWEEVIGFIDLNQVYVMCSGLPNGQISDMIYDIFPNCSIFYPFTEIITKGLNADEIKQAFNKRQNYSKKV